MASGSSLVMFQTTMSDLSTLSRFPVSSLPRLSRNFRVRPKFHQLADPFLAEGSLADDGPRRDGLLRASWPRAGWSSTGFPCGASVGGVVRG